MLVSIIPHTMRAQSNILTLMEWMWPKIWSKIIEAEKIPPKSVELSLVLKIIDDPNFYSGINSPDVRFSIEPIL